MPGPTQEPYHLVLIYLTVLKPKQQMICGGARIRANTKARLEY